MKLRGRFVISFSRAPRDRAGREGRRGAVGNKAKHIGGTHTQTHVVTVQWRKQNAGRTRTHTHTHLRTPRNPISQKKMDFLQRMRRCCCAKKATFYVLYGVRASGGDWFCVRDVREKGRDCVVIPSRYCGSSGPSSPFSSPFGSPPMAPSSPSSRASGRMNGSASGSCDISKCR